MGLQLGFWVVLGSRPCMQCHCTCCVLLLRVVGGLCFSVVCSFVLFA